MTIVCDSREQRWEHVKNYFDASGIQWVRSKLFCGDYSRLDNQTVCIDRKKDLQEVAQNLLQQHERFRAECVRAQDSGIWLVVMIEHGIRIKSIEDVRTWENPRLNKSPKAITGPRLAAIMETMADRYDVSWQFCTKSQTGKRITELLQIGEVTPVCCGRSSFEVRHIDALPFLCCSYCDKPHHVISKRELERGI